MAEKRSLKGKHVDMLDAIAKKLGVDPSEAFGHVVGRAHQQMFGSGGEVQEGAPKPNAKEPANGGESSKKGTGQDVLEQVGEPHDGHQLEDSSNEHQDAPARGDRPNPLALQSSKRWASTKEPDDEAERQRSVARQKQVLASGKAQR